MNLEVPFRLPSEYDFLKADGQGRIVCFLVKRTLEPPRVMIIHLDHPGIIVESKFLKSYPFEDGRTVSNSHSPYGFTDNVTRVSSPIYGASVSRPKA